MKRFKSILTLTYAAVAMFFLSSCLENDEFDGLTDNRPEIAVEFPGREFNQNMGLAFISSGFASDPTATVTMELVGGSANVTSIDLVEGFGQSIAAGSCGVYQTVEEDVAASGRSLTYQITLDELAGSPATCNPVILAPDVFFTLIFTLNLDNGEQIVTQPVRVGFTE